MKKKPIIKIVVFVCVAILAAGAVLYSTKIGTKKYHPQIIDDRVQILFLGDSNLAYGYGAGTIPEMIEQELNANIYNCAIGGTAAAKLNTSNYFENSFDLYNLYNIAKIMECEDHQIARDYFIDADWRERETAKKLIMLPNIDYDTLDYVVISYGLNDYSSGVPLAGEDAYDEETYLGAMRYSVETIRRICPNAKIILSSITYCVFEQEGEAPEDGYVKDWGGGTIDQYRDGLEMVAGEYEGVYFLDNLEDLNINHDTYRQYLADSIHLNEDGQRLYVDNFLSFVEEIESDEDE